MLPSIRGGMLFVFSLGDGWGGLLRGEVIYPLVEIEVQGLDKLGFQEVGFRP